MHLTHVWGQWGFALKTAMRNNLSKVKKETQGYLGLLLVAQSEVWQQQILSLFRSQWMGPGMLMKDRDPCLTHKKG